MQPRSRRRQAAVPRPATTDSPARRIRASRGPAAAGHGRATRSRAPSLREREDADQPRTRSGQPARFRQRPDMFDVRARARSDSLRRDRPDTPPRPRARDLDRRGAWPDRRTRANRRRPPTFAAHSTPDLAQVPRAWLRRLDLVDLFWARQPPASKSSGSIPSPLEWGRHADVDMGDPWHRNRTARRCPRRLRWHRRHTAVRRCSCRRRGRFGASRRGDSPPGRGALRDARAGRRGDGDRGLAHSLHDDRRRV